MPVGPDRPDASKVIDRWRGDFGDDYVQRNSAAKESVRQRINMWGRILRSTNGAPPKSILEVGSNVGLNLRALKQISSAEVSAVEPNGAARSRLLADDVLPANRIYDATAQHLPLKAGAIDLVFTCGVLIHVPPAQLLDACREIYRVANRYIVTVEYFAREPETIQYRGFDDMLFKRDFGGFWLDNFPVLTVLDYGFEWRRLTGIDDATWWVFRKRD